MSVGSVVVTPNPAYCSTSSSVQLTATVYDASGSVLSGYPVSWVAARPVTASVNSTGLVTGHVHSFLDGTKVTATAVSTSVSGITWVIVS